MLDFLSNQIRVTMPVPAAFHFANNTAFHFLYNDYTVETSAFINLN